MGVFRGGVSVHIGINPISITQLGSFSDPAERIEDVGRYDCRIAAPDMIDPQNFFVKGNSCLHHGKRFHGLPGREQQLGKIPPRHIRARIGRAQCFLERLDRALK